MKTKLCLFSLFALLFVPSLHAQADCWQCHIVDGDPICQGSYMAGKCTCTPGTTSCTVYGICSEGTCQCPPECDAKDAFNIDKLRATQPDEYARIKQAVDEHANIVTVFMSQHAYDQGMGKLWTDMAAREGRAIRFIIPSANMTKEQAEQYNRDITKIQIMLHNEEYGPNKK